VGNAAKELLRRFNRTPSCQAVPETIQNPHGNSFGQEGWGTTCLVAGGGDGRVPEADREAVTVASGASAEVVAQGDWGHLLMVPSALLKPDRIFADIHAYRTLHEEAPSK
jgi:hypothetical protein